MVRRLLPFVYPALLFFIVLFLALANSTPGTYLSGWDTLHPEFNFPLAIERLFFGVWRGDQGLGAVAAHSHIAELPRVLLLWLSSLVLPDAAIRYVFYFASLLLGPLGIYVGLLRFLPHSPFRRMASFAGALVYLCNLGTVQQFIVPFEMFAVQYATLPWIFLTSYLYIQHPSRKSFFFFSLVIFFSAPMAYAATLWYAFFGCFTLFIFILGGRKHLRYSLALLTGTILLNAYWLLPNMYFIATHGQEVRESKVNQMFSEEAFAKNQLFGTPKDVPILRNFLYDWQIRNPETGNFESLMNAWQTHEHRPLVLLFGYLVFGLSVFGVIVVLAKRPPVFRAFLPVYLLSGLMLLNGIFPMTVIFEAVGNNLGIVKEALRFPFTKFSILFMSSIAFFAGYGVFFLARHLPGKKVWVGGITILVSLPLLYFFFPAFQGNLLHPSMRVSIPGEYFDMFSWFQKQNPTERVAILPIHSFWNWVYYDWGFQGAGFLQFGIPQPILDRDYDRWNPVNEQYQREMTYAVYSQDPGKIQEVLEKHHVKWVLFDTSVISPGNSDGSTLAWLIPELLSHIPAVQLKEQFGSTLFVYEVTSQASSPVLIYTHLPSVGPSSLGSQVDVAFEKLGPYVSYSAGNEFTDPTRAIFQKNERIDQTQNITGTLIAEVDAYRNPLSDHQAYPCAYNGILNGTRTITAFAIEYASVDTPLCDYVGFPDLDHANAYLIEVTTKHEEGFPLQLCIGNNLTRHCDMFVHLNRNQNFTTERFLLPPLTDYGFGYTLNFNNYTIRGKTSRNSIESIRIKVLDYTQFSRAYPTDYEKAQPQGARSVRVNPAYYSTPLLNGNANQTIVLDQSYEEGWKAYTINDENFMEKTFPFLFGEEMKTHVVANNWANGWDLPEDILSNNQSMTVVIFFLPQLLQWIGFALLPIPFLLLLRKKKHHYTPSPEPIIDLPDLSMLLK